MRELVPQVPEPELSRLELQASLLMQACAIKLAKMLRIDPRAVHLFAGQLCGDQFAAGNYNAAFAWTTAAGVLIALERRVSVLDAEKLLAGVPPHHAAWPAAVSKVERRRREHAASRDGNQELAQRTGRDLGTDAGLDRLLEYLRKVDARARKGGR